MLLDGFSIQTFNDFGLPIDENGHPIPLRSLASVVKNDLITITGNSLIFPVAAGYKVGKSFIIEKTKITDKSKEGEDENKRVTLFDHYKPITPIEPYRISVPSRGVFAEAVQGACNACEKIETERLQGWTRFPNTDEPTSISPITTPTPVITDWKAAFKDFATPIVNIQNAPTAPAPGAGLAGLSELLGKSGVFKDITGLDANQQNVLKTYLSNQENAKAFAEMAKEMAMQSHNTQNSGKIMDTITQAKNAGDISKEDAGKLVKDHLQQQIDGGETKKAELENEKQAQSSEEQQAATESIRKIPAESIESVETTGPSGATTTVKAKPGGGIAATIQNLVADTLIGALPDGGQQRDAGTLKSPWPLIARWSDSPDGGPDYKSGYNTWVLSNFSSFDNEEDLCNWFPLRLLVEYAATNGLRVRLKYWQGQVPLKGVRSWDRTTAYILDSHGGDFGSKVEFYRRVSSTVTAEMIGRLNTLPVAPSSTHEGDLVLYDGGDRFWHAEVIVAMGPPIARESGTVTQNADGGALVGRKPRSARLTGPRVPAGALDGMARRWAFSNFD